MSRYVQVRAPVVADRDTLCAALTRLGLSLGLDLAPQHRHGRGQLMLEGSLECEGEPVDVRIAPGPFDTVEDFGFVLGGGELRLVCGELDRDRLERDLLAPLTAALTESRVRRAAATAGLTVETTEQANGTRRLLVRRRD